MNAAVFLICGIAGFFIGFSFGLLRKFPYKTPERRLKEAVSEEILRMRQEYDNFLKYDGSDQV